MIRLFLMGQPLFMFPLLAASVVVLTLAIERWIHYRRATIDYDAFDSAMRSVLRERGIAAARTFAEETPGPIARVWSEGLLVFRLPFPLIRERMESVASREVARLEKRLHHLSILGQLAPLIGILGTVWGMIDAFQSIEPGLAHGGGIQNELLVGGIWQALITTAGGLFVAIPALFLHHQLTQRVDGFVEDMERSMSDLIACLVPLRLRTTGAAGVASAAGLNAPRGVSSEIESLA